MKSDVLVVVELPSEVDDELQYQSREERPTIIPPTIKASVGKPKMRLSRRLPPTRRPQEA